jgi:hypothetical protein
VRKKITRISVTLLAAASVLGAFGVAAPAAYAWSATGVACSEASPSWCIDMGSGGVGDPVKAFAYNGTVSNGNLSQALEEGLVLPAICNNDHVSEGAPGEGPPCPFKAGSHMNEAFDRDLITTLYNPTAGVPGPVYAAHSDGKVYAVTAGDGQLWVQDGGINSSTYGSWVNIYYSNLKLSEELLCENGNGAQLSVNDSGASSCRWEERSN